MTAAAMRNRYTEEAVRTASPARLLIMLFDRLLRDLTSAEQSLAAGEEAHEALLHAQRIVCELNLGLDTSVWNGAAGLSSLYVFINERLVTANIRRDKGIVVECRELVQPLRDAWVQAALASAAQAS